MIDQINSVLFAPTTHSSRAAFKTFFIRCCAASDGSVETEERSETAERRERS